VIILFTGSDLAGETAAALAAASMVFRTDKPEYATKCLSHARQLYRFASQYRGLYHEATRALSNITSEIFNFFKNSLCKKQPQKYPLEFYYAVLTPP